MQPLLDFTVPPADPTRVSASLPPIAPGTGLSRHCSAMGALEAQKHQAAQMARLLAAYRAAGAGLTDVEAEAVTGIQKSSVIPRRRTLMAAGLVREVAIRRNATTGRSNTVYEAISS